MTPDRKRRDLFLTLIDALLEHVKLNSRMDIRDRIAALALVDWVLAREKSVVDAERAGSKVREYSGSFTEARAAANHGRAADPRQPTRPAKPSLSPSPMTARATTTERTIAPPPTDAALPMRRYHRPRHRHLLPPVRQSPRPHPAPSNPALAAVFHAGCASAPPTPGVWVAASARCCRRRS